MIFPLNNLLRFSAISLFFINFFLFFFPIVQHSEESFIEILSALFYLFSFIICCFSFKKRKNFFILIYLILSFLFLMEETNWLQLFFDYSVPSIERLNSQNEVSIHNLYIFRHGGLRGSSLNLFILFDSQNLFRLFFGSIFFILPTLNYKYKVIYDNLRKIGYRSPTKSLIITLIFLLITNIICTISVPYASDHSTIFAEIRELTYSFYICYYSYEYMKNYN